MKFEVVEISNRELTSCTKSVKEQQDDRQKKNGMNIFYNFGDQNITPLNFNIHDFDDEAAISEADMKLEQAIENTNVCIADMESDFCDSASDCSTKLATEIDHNIQSRRILTDHPINSCYHNCLSRQYHDKELQNQHNDLPFSSLSTPRDKSACHGDDLSGVPYDDIALDDSFDSSYLADELMGNISIDPYEHASFKFTPRPSLSYCAETISVPPLDLQKANHTDTSMPTVGLDYAAPYTHSLMPDGSHPPTTAITRHMGRKEKQSPKAPSRLEQLFVILSDVEVLIIKYCHILLECDHQRIASKTIAPADVEEIIQQLEEILYTFHEKVVHLYEDSDSVSNPDSDSSNSVVANRDPTTSVTRTPSQPPSSSSSNSSASFASSHSSRKGGYKCRRPSVTDLTLTTALDIFYDMYFVQLAHVIPYFLRKEFNSPEMKLSIDIIEILATLHPSNALSLVIFVSTLIALRVEPIDPFNLTRRHQTCVKLKSTRNAPMISRLWRNSVLPFFSSSSSSSAANGNTSSRSNKPLMTLSPPDNLSSKSDKRATENVIVDNNGSLTDRSKYSQAQSPSFIYQTPRSDMSDSPRVDVSISRDMMRMVTPLKDLRTPATAAITTSTTSATSTLAATMTSATDISSGASVLAYSVDVSPSASHSMSTGSPKNRHSAHNRYPLFQRTSDMRSPLTDRSHLSNSSGDDDASKLAVPSYDLTPLPAMHSLPTIAEAPLKKSITAASGMVLDDSMSVTSDINYSLHPQNDNQSIAVEPVEADASATRVDGSSGKNSLAGVSGSGGDCSKSKTSRSSRSSPSYDNTRSAASLTTYSSNGSFKTALSGTSRILFGGDNENSSAPDDDIRDNAVSDHNVVYATLRRRLLQIISQTQDILHDEWKVQEEEFRIQQREMRRRQQRKRSTSLFLTAKDSSNLLTSLRGIPPPIYSTPRESDITSTPEKSHGSKLVIPVSPMDISADSIDRSLIGSADDGSDDELDLGDQGVYDDDYEDSPYQRSNSPSSTSSCSSASSSSTSSSSTSYHASNGEVACFVTDAALRGFNTIFIDCVQGASKAVLHQALDYRNISNICADDDDDEAGDSVDSEDDGDNGDQQSVYDDALSEIDVTLPTLSVDEPLDACRCDNGNESARSRHCAIIKNKKGSENINTCSSTSKSNKNVVAESCRIRKGVIGRKNKRISKRRFHRKTYERFRSQFLSLDNPGDASYSYRLTHPRFAKSLHLKVFAPCVFNVFVEDSPQTKILLKFKFLDDSKVYETSPMAYDVGDDQSDALLCWPNFEFSTTLRKSQHQLFTNVLSIELWFSNAPLSYCKHMGTSFVPLSILQSQDLEDREFIILPTQQSLSQSGNPSLLSLNISLLNRT